MELVAIGSFFGDVQDFLQGQAARVQLTAISTPMGSFQQSIIMNGTQVLPDRLIQSECVEQNQNMGQKQTEGNGKEKWMDM